jgi:hypothetical protein
VHVGVEEIVFEHLREEDFDAVFGQPLDVGAHLAQPGHVGDLHTADAFHDHHLRATEIPVHRGYVQQW